MKLKNTTVHEQRQMTLHNHIHVHLAAVCNQNTLTTTSSCSRKVQLPCDNEHPTPLTLPPDSRQRITATEI